MPRAVLYARVSSDDRHNASRNLQGQLELGRRYCQEHGYSITGELAEDDRGASGATFELPQLTQARAWAEAGLYDVLVVRELDRLSRNLVKQLVVEAELEAAGVTIEYVLGEYPDTPEGRLHKHIRATIAEYERELIAARTVRAKRQKVAAGHVLVHGRPPLGYRLATVGGKQTLEIVVTEAASVRQVYDLYLGGLSVRGVQRQLTAAGVPTAADLRGHMAKRRPAGAWSLAAVHNILSNETYAGVWHYGKNKRVAKHLVHNDPATWLALPVPAIIPRAQWQAVQERLAAGPGLAPRNTQREYLLRARLTCAACGAATVSHRAPHDRLMYRCNAATSRGRDYVTRCHAPHFSAAHVDAVVWDWLRGLLLEPERLAQGLAELQAQASGPLQAQAADLAARLTAVDAQAGRLLDLYLTGNLRRELLDDRQGKLAAQRAEVARQQADVGAQLAALAAPLQAAADFAPVAAAIRARWPQAEADFSFRAWVVDQLQVRGRLAVEEGVKVVYVRCALSGPQDVRLEPYAARPATAIAARLVVGADAG